MHKLHGLDRDELGLILAAFFTDADLRETCAEAHLQTADLRSEQVKALLEIHEAQGSLPVPTAALRCALVGMREVCDDPAAHDRRREADIKLLGLALVSMSDSFVFGVASRLGISVESGGKVAVLAGLRSFLLGPVDILPRTGKRSFGEARAHLLESVVGKLEAAGVLALRPTAGKASQ